jgi:hypothetical protein
MQTPISSGRSLFLWGQAQILILKILNVFLPALWNAKHIPLGWLKFSPFLALNKIERFAKVSMWHQAPTGSIQ